jgi:hypothetical protein
MNSKKLYNIFTARAIEILQKKGGTTLQVSRLHFEANFTGNRV